jgi:hypothetical protein
MAPTESARRRQAALGWRRFVGLRSGGRYEGTFAQRQTSVPLSNTIFHWPAASSRHVDA